MSNQTQPNPSATAPAGWYRIDGDPPGTMRRWNGAQWIGVPTFMEGTAEAGPSVDRPVGRLSVSALVAAAVSVLGFVFMALLMITLFVTLQQSHADVGSDYFDTRGITNLGDLVPDLGGMLLVLGLLVIITTVSFNSWATNAALASNAVSGSKMRKGSRQRQSNFALIIVYIFLGLFFVILVALFGSSRGASARPSLFELVSRTAAAVKLGPMKVFVWWVLLWGGCCCGHRHWSASARCSGSLWPAATISARCSWRSALASSSSRPRSCRLG